MLVSAQRVCTTCWNVCHDDPSMWRVIDIKNNVVNIKADVLNKLCRIAVGRSQSQLVKISIDNFGNKDLLYCIAQRSSGLRHLRLVRCYYIDDGCLAAAARNFALLEELHVYLCNISSGFNKDDIKVIGHSCPLLKSFTLNAQGFLGYQCNDEALAVARNMPELRHLALLGNVLTNEGLHAILDGCTHLESLDLRHCYNIDLDGDLGRCKQQIIDFKDPHDSTYGYEFHAQISDYLSPYEDYPDQITDSDDDFHWFSLLPSSAMGSMMMLMTTMTIYLAASILMEVGSYEGHIPTENTKNEKHDSRYRKGERQNGLFDTKHAWWLHLAFCRVLVALGDLASFCNSNWLQLIL